MTWVNTGDINPESGTVLMKAPSIDRNGDFSSEAVQTIPESQVGGDEKRFLLRMGIVFLASRNFASALEVVGARLEGSEIVRPDHNGGEERFALTSEEGLRELFLAAHAFGGIDDVDIESLVQIGKDEIFDQDRKFPGERSMYRAGYPLKRIMERELDGFEYPQDRAQVLPAPADEPGPEFC